MRRLLIAVTVLVLGACGSGGGGDGNDVASLGDAKQASSDQPQEKDREKAFLDFAACMREHGIDMPDPQVSDNGTVMRVRPADRVGAPPDEKKMEEADKACRHHVEGVGGGPGRMDDPEMQDRLVKFAQCMREQGVDMPDPKSEGGGRVAFRMNEGDRDKFEAARKACEHVAPMRAGVGGTSVEVGR